MPNHVTNILDAENLLVLPVFTEDKDGNKQFDFNKIIPMPEELNVTAGGYMDSAISCYMTKVQDVEVNKIVKDYFSKPFKFGKPHILTKEEIEDITKSSKKSFDELVEIGKRYVNNIEKYGETSWYDWCCSNWGTKWNSYEMQELDDNTIEFLTAWSPPENVVIKLSEMYPDKTFHLLYCDEFIGQFAGEAVYQKGFLVDEVYAEGLDDPNMADLIYKIYGFTIVDCYYINKDGELVKKTCEGCKYRDEDCDRLR